MRFVVLILLFFITFSSFSQRKGYFVLEPSYSYYNQHELNFAVIRSLDFSDQITNIPVGYLGPFISGGLNFANNKELLVTKTGIVCFLYFIGARISLINYTNFNSNQFSFRPEIGLTLAGFISVTYGYNFKLSTSDIYNIQSNVITISIGIPPHIFKK